MKERREILCFENVVIIRFFVPISWARKTSFFTIKVLSKGNYS